MNPAERHVSAICSSALCPRASKLAESDQLHALVLHPTRLDHGGPEAAGDTLQYALFTEYCSRRGGAAEAVLDREHDRVGAEERGCGTSSSLDIHRLGRDDDEVGDSHLLNARRGADRDGPITACSGNAKPAPADGVDVLLPRVDGPDLVAGRGEKPGVDRAHRAGAEDGDLHERPSLAGYPLSGTA